MNCLTKKKRVSSIDLKISLVFFILAIIIQLIILTQYKNNDPTFSAPQRVTDSVQFINSAKSIASGEIVGKGKFVQAPLYNYFLGTIIYIFGDSLWTIRFVQVIIASLNFFILYFISLILFNDRYTAILSNIILIFTGIFYFYNILILREFLVVTLNNLFILIFLLSIDKEKPLLNLLAGIIFILTILCRPNMLIFIPLTLIYLFIKNKRKFILFFIGALSILVLLVIRNYKAETDLFSISTKGPYEFASGNVPDTNGVGWQELNSAKRLYKENPDFPKMIAAVLNLYSDNYLKLFKLQFNKFMAFINNYEPANNYFFNFFKDKFISALNFLFINFSIIFIFGIIGIISSILKYKTDKNFICLTYIIFYSLTVIGTYIISRFRIPVTVFLIIYSGFGLIQIFKTIKQKKYKQLAIILVFILFLSYFSIFYKYKGKSKTIKSDYALSYANTGAYYRNKKEYDKALKYYIPAINHFPAEEGFITIGSIYKDKGNNNKALEWYKKCLNYYPTSYKALKNIAVISYNNKNYKNAIKYLSLLGKYNSYKITDLYILGDSYYNLKKYNLTIKYLETLLNEYSGNDYIQAVLLRLGNSYYFLNQLKKTEYYWKKLLELTPNDSRLKHNLTIIRKKIHQK